MGLDTWSKRMTKPMYDQLSLPVQQVPDAKVRRAASPLSSLPPVSTLPHTWSATHADQLAVDMLHQLCATRSGTWLNHASLSVNVLHQLLATGSGT